MPATAPTLEKSLPHNLEAERALLGSILLDNQALGVAVETVTKDDFFSDAHRLIFERMLKLSELSRAFDLVTLSEELSREGFLEKIGGAAYLASLTDGIPIGTSAAAEEYARIVKEKALVRRLINISNNVIGRCLEGADDSATLIDLAQGEIFQIAMERVPSGFKGVLDIVKESYGGIETMLERGRIATGIRSGFEKLDEMTCGFQPGELIVIAARPSLGKTALALNIAAHAALHENKKVGLFSLEMNNQSLVVRLLCSEGRVDSHLFRSGFWDIDRERKKIMEALGRLAEAPIYIEDTPALSVMQIRTKARRVKAEKGLDLLIVDYLQLVTGHGRFENRTQEVSYVSRGLKSIAKELNIPVIALSQLSRAPEQRPGQKPQLSDLRESGSIEQDADVVIFIFREKRSDEEEASPREGVETKLIIGKQRNGPIGDVPLVFQKSFTRFENPTFEDEPPYIG